MRIRYQNCRTLVTLSGTVRMHLKIRRCEVEDCARYHRPYRPEAEGRLVLPKHEFGLDVIALVLQPQLWWHGSITNDDGQCFPTSFVVTTARLQPLGSTPMRPAQT